MRKKLSVFLGFVAIITLTMGLTMSFPNASVSSNTYSSDNKATPIGKTIWIKAKANDRYLSAWGTANSVELRSCASRVDTWEKFDVVDAGNNLVAMKSHANKRLWTANGSTNDVNIISTAENILCWETYHWINNSDGTFSLKAVANNKYVSVLGTGMDMAVHAKAPWIKKWEKFVYGIVDSDNKPIPTSVKTIPPSSTPTTNPSSTTKPVPTIAPIITSSPAPTIAPPSGSFKVLNYLKSISGQKTLAGQHNREPNSDPTKWTREMIKTTGRTPALWSGDFLFAQEEIKNRWTMIYEAKKQWEQGAVVNIMWHASPPNQGESCGWEGGVLSHLSDSQWNELITDGTSLNKTWKSRMDGIAVYLKYLKDNGVEVLFRPLHEMNQGSFWWGGRPGANGTRRLYQITHDYLTKEKGLTNLIWVWNVQDLSYNFSDYNPGNDYWDLMSLDVYGDGFTEYKYKTVLSVAGNKPIAIGECAVLPTVSELLAQPRWTFFMGWAELVKESNSDQKIKDVYSATNVLTLDELPKWK